MQEPTIPQTRQERFERTIEWVTQTRKRRLSSALPTPPGLSPNMSPQSSPPKRRKVARNDNDIFLELDDDVDRTPISRSSFDAPSLPSRPSRSSTALPPPSVASSTDRRSTSPVKKMQSLRLLQLRYITLLFRTMQRNNYP